MREKKLKGEQQLDLQLANRVWDWPHWERWAWWNKCGLVIEDGLITGWETKPETFHK